MAESESPESALENSPGTDARTQPGTPRVTTYRAASQPERLRAAADALRSGRVEHLTAEWRGELADACERAAEVVTRGEFRHAESEVG